MRVRAKICGITRVQDALEAVKLGADAIGLVFYSASPRNISLSAAADVVQALPPYVSKVGLFVNASKDEIQRVLSAVHLDIIQFHGDESPQFCDQINMPYYKAIRVKDDTNLLQYAQLYQNAKALLLDTYSDTAMGGTGQVFNWDLIPAGLEKPVILAGGLTAENVRLAIEKVRPYAVDVSGGVEQDKGIKDAQKMAAFMQEVNQFRS
ncbi:MAG: phosphoribosylanthranilate isomerase [Methylophilus sp.]|nr:phosphoribosylanthranilate isomerase [Methylophilus sp.]